VSRKKKNVLFRMFAGAIAPEMRKYK